MDIFKLHSDIMEVRLQELFCQPAKLTRLMPYGEDNSYEHPTDRHMDMLKAAGWSHRLNTIDGNITLGLLPGSSLPTFACGDANCNLEIEQR